MRSQREASRSGDDRSDEPAVLEFERICIDFASHRTAYEKQFLDFVDRHQALLQLPEAGDRLEAYLDRVWPDGLPATGIFANTRPFDHYLLRPPSEGPLAAGFAAGSLAPAFALLESGRGFRVIGFSVTPHVEPRWFERSVSGLFVRSWRERAVRSPAPLLFWQEPVALPDPGMTEQDLQALRQFPEHRKVTHERLQGWSRYLDWKENLIRRDQIALRYTEWRLNDGMLEFLVRGEAAPRLRGKALMAVAVSESTNPDKWIQKGKREPRGRELGEVARVETRDARGDDKGPSALVVIEPEEELVAELEEAADEAERGKLLRDEGFLLSAIIGDLAPLKNQRQGLERLRDGRSFAPRLAEYIFDASLALGPRPEQPMAELPAAERLNSRLNEDQLTAVRGALAAPDLFLIQGPPGTGKTTVIAEICYQVARRGGRLLVASQTNLAVDNALARLGNRPDMRPLRLGEASRVGDEFKEFLQENVIERWFRGIRAECERRWMDREAAERQTRDADEDLESLRQIVRDRQECAEELQPLEAERASLQRQIDAQQKLAATRAEIAHEEAVRAEALQAVVRWLSAEGEQPSARSLAQTRWAEALPKEVARIPSRPVFPEEPCRAEGGSDGLRKALERIEGARLSREIAEQLEPAVAQMLILCRGQLGAASEESARKLQVLLDEQRRLADSEDEGEVLRLPQVNREIKRLRGQVWTGVCRQVAGGLVKLWGEEPPTLLEEMAASIEPHARYTATLEAFGAWLAGVRRLSEDLTAASLRLAQAAAHEADERQRLAHTASQDADAARVRIAQIRDQQSVLGDRIAEIERRAEGLRAPWGEAWARLGALLQQDDGEAPWPPPEGAADQRAALLAEWRSSRAAEGERHRRWRGIQSEWLQRIREPSAADREHLTELYVDHSNVVGMTCNEAGKWHFYEKEGFRPFDVVIVDEVSKATPPELLLPMLLGRKAVLVGDQRQLPPMFRERESSYQDAIESGELSRDDFERFRRMVTSSLFEELFDQTPESLKASLWTQYRMHPQVMRAVNYFYSGQLLPGPDEETLSTRRAHRLTLRDRGGGRLLEPNHHLLWIDSSLDEQGRAVFEDQAGTSKVNELEVRIIGRLLYLLDNALRQQGYAPRPREDAEAGSGEEGQPVRDWLARLLSAASPETLADVLSRDVVWLNGRAATGSEVVRSGDRLRFDPRLPVGVISFYGKQLGRLKAVREELHRQLARLDRSSVLDVRMDTVDRFQGMERPIVIVSLVRAVKHFGGGDFVRDFRRINVALSRAQGLLVIVGAKQTFEQALVELPAAAAGQPPPREAVYRKIFEHAARCGGRRDARSVPEAPWEKRK